MKHVLPEFDPKRDLCLQRVVDVRPEQVWKAWTTPEILMRWFTPAPWKTVGCELDVRPGGRFHTVMQSPEGELFPDTGCYLEVVENEKLVWTSALEDNYRPKIPVQDETCAAIVFTAYLLLEPVGTGTRYTALVLHDGEAGCRRHDEMGFQHGWGAALDQLVALIQATDG